MTVRSMYAVYEQTKKPRDKRDALYINQCTAMYVWCTGRFMVYMRCSGWCSWCTWLVYMVMYIGGVRVVYGMLPTMIMPIIKACLTLALRLKASWWPRMKRARWKRNRRWEKIFIYHQRKRPDRYTGEIKAVRIHQYMEKRCKRGYRSSGCKRKDAGPL